jgi:Mg/Co/Ni transporter MgtE
VLDRDRRLIGVISLRAMLVARPEQTLDALMSPDVITVSPETEQEEVARLLARYDLLASGGNAGSQSATLMVRALATGDVRMSDWFRLLGKEVVVALLLGCTMAIGVAAVASFRAPEIIVIVAATMVCVVLVGSLVGLTLPFIFTRFGLDPATASAPLITSIADISGVIIYFSIATWYLGLEDGVLGHTGEAILHWLTSL